jgi:hypothetical protein
MSHHAHSFIIALACAAASRLACGVRGRFHVKVVSFSRKIVSSRIPFVSCLYSVVFKNTCLILRSFDVYSCSKIPVCPPGRCALPACPPGVSSRPECPPAPRARPVCPPGVLSRRECPPALPACPPVRCARPVCPPGRCALPACPPGVSSRQSGRWRTQATSVRVSLLG